MCRGHDPLFSGQSALPSLPIYHHCAALMPPFSNCKKNFHFQPCFGQNFSSQGANFPNFRSLDPSFFKENPLPRPYFLKPVWHTPTKKKLSAPPGLPPCWNWLMILWLQFGQEENSITTFYIYRNGFSNNVSASGLVAFCFTNSYKFIF